MSNTSVNSVISDEDLSKQPSVVRFTSFIMSLTDQPDQDQPQEIKHSQKPSVKSAESISSIRSTSNTASIISTETEGSISKEITIKPAKPVKPAPAKGEKDHPKLDASIKDATEPVSAATLVETVEDDATEFSLRDTTTGFEMEETMPKSRFRDQSFIKLQQFLETIIGDLENAQTHGIPLGEVKEEFYFVWEAIKKSHDSLQHLLQQDIKISIEVADTMAKTRNLIRIAEDHPDKALVLGRRLEAAWNLVDISEAEEKKNNARLQELEAEIGVLNRNITAAANMEGRAELNELMKLKKKMGEEQDSLTKELSRMKTSLTLLQERKLRQVDRKLEYQDMIKFADEEDMAQNEALVRETARKGKIEQYILDTTKNMEAKTKELADMEEQMSVANLKIDDLDRTIREQRIINEVANREADAAWSKQEKLRGDVEGQIALVERLALDAYKRQTELKAKEDEIALRRIEGARTERHRLENMKKCESMQETLESLEKERENLRNKILQLERDLERAQHRLEDSKKEVEELDKQRTLVNRNVQRVVAVTGEYEDNIKINSIAVDNLQGELDGFNREIGIQTETIRKLERERDYYGEESAKLATIAASRMETVKHLDLSLYEHKMRVADLEGELKTSQQSYDAAAVEKQYYERALRDAVNEINESAKNIRNVRFEKNSLEYREMDRQSACIAEEERRDTLVKEGDFFKTEASRMHHMAIDIQHETEALERERFTLGSAIATSANEIGKQGYYASSAESRKQNYNRKLMQKESELKETWEKWRTLHSMVRIGAYHYRNIMREIVQMRQSIMNLRQEQLHFKGNVNHIVQLKQEISTLENCVAKETCMIHALEEELTRPINIHRWRVLEAMNPDAYSLVKKINIVTKRLVDNNEQIRKQNIRISDQEHAYVDIKSVSRHLPGLETPEERQYYEVLYKAKKQQLELLKHEMYANEVQTAFFRNQVAQLNKRMMELKQEYFKKMKV